MADSTQVMLAVELDGSSHGNNPFRFGQTHEAAMQQQDERDRDKNAELKRRCISSVRIKVTHSESIALLRDALDMVSKSA